LGAGARRPRARVGARWRALLARCASGPRSRAAPAPAARAARYTRFLRDEVLAEWAAGSLHVHCHVRGDAEWWLAPRQLRGFIFRREMPLVLDTVRFADRDFLSQHAGARAAQRARARARA
jgi:hypothetical protein